MLQLNGNNYLLRIPLHPVEYAARCFESHEHWHTEPEFLYGIYLSSKALYQEYEKQRQAGALTGKMLQTLQKYWLRSSTRCTPYANFAACAMGLVSERTLMQPASVSTYKESCRPDMDLLHKFLENLSGDAALNQQLTWYTNNSLYRQGKKYRYVKFQVQNNKRRYFLAEAAHNVYLQAVVQKAGRGAAFRTLVTMLEEAGIDEESATDYLQVLIQNQVLCSELEPCITGEQPFSRLKEQLKTLKGFSTVSMVMEEMEQLLQQQHFSIPPLEAVTEKINQLGIDHSSLPVLFQSDVYAGMRENTVSQTVIDQILKETSTIMAVLFQNRTEHANLSQFKSRFTDRYEQQEVPLQEVLDVECGIGYGTFNNNTAGFANGLTFNQAADSSKQSFNYLLRRKLESSAVRAESSITITDEDLLPLIQPQESCLAFAGHQSGGLFGNLYGKDEAGIDSGEFQFHLRLINGPSGANMLGRFCHLHTAVADWAKDIAASEAQWLPEDTIYAEVVHLPQERMGNILLRPVLRGYEIPFMGRSGAAADQQLPVSDLMVSVQNNRIVLRSKSLNKYVIPRLTTAHNYVDDSLPMYQFLCELQLQYAFPGFSLEDNSDEQMTYFPELRYRHLILQRERWRLTKDDLKDMPEDDTNLSAFIEQLRKKKKLPQQVLLVFADNELLIDLRFPQAFRLLAAELRKLNSVVVAAFPAMEAMGAVSGEQGHYCNELLLPVKILAATSIPVNSKPNGMRKYPQRIFLPGNEWAYFKLYCGTHAAEELLSSAVPRLTKTILERRFADQFFFIRYADPDPHIRLRFKLTKPAHFADIVALLNSSMTRYAQQKQLFRVQLDTYVRELERYDPELIEETETLFWHDSQTVLDLLKHTGNNDAGEKKWQLAVAGMHQYLLDFGYDDAGKLRLVTMLQQAFFQEFGGGKPLNLSLNDKYRSLKQELFQVFAEQPEPFIAKGRKILLQRAYQRKPVVKKIQSVLRRKNQTADILLGSYLHMFINRLFETDNRKYELILYHLLMKYYTAAAAMQQNKTVS